MWTISKHNGKKLSSAHGIHYLDLVLPGAGSGAGSEPRWVLGSYHQIILFVSTVLFILMGQSLHSPISPLGTSFHSFQICPFGEKLFKKQLGECCGSPAIVNNNINTQHDLFIATNLLNPKPLAGIPSWFLHSLMMQHGGVYFLLWVSVRKQRHQSGQFLTKRHPTAE